uniref:Transposase Tnp1/En/Spm-like domain-containing protein n=1 Tax=Ananas comosus var. bracteatus TaxID=296719 RepID=A0A6V7Q2T1_ANACO|nr:unnamed protein product [Ananas comosus var. bracteatus]
MDSKGKERSSKRPYSDQRDYDEMLLGSDHFLHEFLRNELHSTKSLEDQPALSLEHALHHYMNHLVSSLHQEQRPSLTSEILDNNIPVQIGSTQNQHDLAKQLHDNIMMGQINEICSLYSDIAGKKASRDDLFARILGEDKRNTIRSYGLGVAATKVFGLDPTRAECLRMLSESENEHEKERHEMQQQLDNMKQKYEDMQNEVAILKAQFEAISKRPEGVPTSRRKDMQHNEILDTIPVVNANVCPKEPSWNEVSSLQSSYEIPQNQESRSRMKKIRIATDNWDGSEVYLKSLKKPHNNVAQGTLLSKDPKTKVGGVELGPQCWEIQIDIPIIRVEPLLRSYKGYRTIGDAVGASVAWPFTFIKRK